MSNPRPAGPNGHSSCPVRRTITDEEYAACSRIGSSCKSCVTVSIARGAGEFVGDHKEQAAAGGEFIGDPRETR